MTDPQREKIISAAWGEVGVREMTGNNDGIPSERYCDGRRIPWCAAFVVWCYRQAGIKIPGNRWKLPSVDYLEQQIKVHGVYAVARHVVIWYGLGVETELPQPGDIVFFKNRGDSDTGGGRHCGIVEMVHANKIHTIEGNKGNKVGRGIYALDNPRISGYGRI